MTYSVGVVSIENLVLSTAIPGKPVKVQTRGTQYPILNSKYFFQRYAEKRGGAHGVAEKGAGGFRILSKSFTFTPFAVSFRSGFGSEIRIGIVLAK
jgi:hypothetical protein